MITVEKLNEMTKAELIPVIMKNIYDSLSFYDEETVVIDEFVEDNISTLYVLMYTSPNGANFREGEMEYRDFYNLIKDFVKDNEVALYFDGIVWNRDSISGFKIWNFKWKDKEKEKIQGDLVLVPADSFLNKSIILPNGIKAHLQEAEQDGK